MQPDKTLTFTNIMGEDSTFVERKGSHILRTSVSNSVRFSHNYFSQNLEDVTYKNDNKTSVNLDDDGIDTSGDFMPQVERFDIAQLDVTPSTNQSKTIVS